MRVIKDDVIKAQLVEALAGKLIAQQRGVTLDVGVKALLGDEVGRDALDLGGRAAMQRGLGDGVGHARRNGLDKRGVDMLKLIQVGECQARHSFQTSEPLASFMPSM